MTRIAAVALSLILAGCAATPAVQTGPAPVAVPARAGTTGPAGVIGDNARALEGRFGRPALDVREGTARKLQFVNSVCVLDAYLYPPGQGAEPVVTHVDARLPDGRDLDRASCIASLSAR